MSQTKAQLISDLVQALAFTATASAPTNGMFLSATNELAISTNSNKRLTVDSDGRLLVVASSSVDVASTAAAEFQVKTTGNITAAFYSIANAAGPAGILALGHGRSTAGGVLQEDDVRGEIRFAGGDGTDLETQGASIVAQVDGTPG